jgi:hypothetical protein
VGRYGWVILATFALSSWWTYSAAVARTAALKQLATLQTLPVSESKDMVLSLTLKDGDRILYVVKPSKGETSNAAGNGRPLKEAIQNWQLSGLGTALSTGDAKLPLGIALNISQ